MTTHPRIFLRRGKEESLLRRHPWIFSGAIGRVECPSDTIAEGEIVDVHTAAGDFIARGHYQIGSIAVRVLTFAQEPIDAAWWRARIRSACEVRRTLGLIGNAATTCYRLVHGEGDSLPGLVIDIYGTTAVVQCHSVGMYRSRMQIAEALKKRFHGEGDDYEAYKGVADLDADSVGMEGTAKIWYIGRFLDGFIFDTNIDEVKQIIYGEVRKTGSAHSYDVQNPDLITAFYYIVPHLKYGQWATLVTTSTNAYGTTGKSGGSSTSPSSNGYTSSYYDYLNYLNYSQMYYGNNGYYGGYYGGYGLSVRQDRSLRGGENMDFGIASVAAITVICYLVGLIVKSSDLDNKYIPAIVGLCGGVLGVAALYTGLQDFPATDPLTLVS